MSDGVTVKVTGLEEIERNMNLLEEDIAKNVAVSAVRDGNKVLHDAIVAAAQSKFTRRTGTLFKNIRTSLAIKGRGVKGVVVKAATYLKSDGFYGRFWELGFQHIGHGKGQRARHRRMRGEGAAGLGKHLRREWMRPAFEAAAPRALEALVARLKEKFGG